MAPRHRAAGRLRGRIPLTVRLLAGLVVLTLLGWLGITVLPNVFGGTDCDSTVSLTVAAAPEIAPAIDELAKEQRCANVHVSQRDSAELIDTVSRPGADPDATIWVPESTLQLQRAADRRPGIPAQGTSVASSPVVLAVAEAVATRAGWPNRPPSWQALTGSANVGLTDPSHDPVAAAALLGLQQAVPDPAQHTALLRKLSNNQVESPSSTFMKLSGEPGSLDAIPASEQRVLNYQATRSGQRGAGSVVASYPEQPAPWLDFPFVVLPGARGEQVTAATELLGRLRAEDAGRTFGKYGFRTPDGELIGASADNRIDTAPRRPVPPAPRAQSDAALQRWSLADASGHVLTVMDVSGSMTAPVPGTGKTRMQVTVEASQKALPLFKPATEYALWEFSTNLNGELDHREVLPWRPMSAHLAEGLATNMGSRLSPPRGATGLYDTTLAAYRELARTWRAGRTNVVIIMTDGRNEDTHGISRADLLAELGKLSKPDRPIPVVFVGLGTDVDSGELNDIAGATGGQVFLAPDVRDIQQIFFTALSKLRCPTGNCPG